MVLSLIALRYEVGGDWRGYVTDYNSENWSRYEFLFSLIAKLLSSLRMPYHIFIGAIALLQIALGKMVKENYGLGPLFLFFYVTLLFFFESLSILRQMVAVPAFYLLLESLRTNRYKNAVLLLILMLGFHLSAIVIFAIIPVAHFLGNLSIKRIGGSH